MRKSKKVNERSVKKKRRRSLKKSKVKQTKRKIKSKRNIFDGTTAEELKLIENEISNVLKNIEEIQRSGEEDRYVLILHEFHMNLVKLYKELERLLANYDTVSQVQEEKTDESTVETDENEQKVDTDT